VGACMARTAEGSRMNCSMECSMNSPQSDELVCCGTSSFQYGQPSSENMRLTPSHVCTNPASQSATCSNHHCRGHRSHVHSQVYSGGNAFSI
jgi:hypothetical protein